jgi:hypothetical protein
VTIVNHAAIDIAASPDALWRAILEDYVTGEKFGSVGYAVEPLDDPAAVLGGYRMRLEQDGAVVDDRIVHVTERDEAARRLSLHADYLSVPGGFEVFATYQAHEVAEGARYTLDCHTRMTVEAPDDGGEADIAATLAGMKAQFGAALDDFFARVKARVEAAD